ncbi:MULTISPECIES: helix-turn-helix domain-containing protein [unclassified Paenibacillus]|uniref:helix-turn-helix domain-containing protein n=1 Tax=unclassified Paenibacillus TaxID=185978 RepID=UPI001C113852|nr:MULTISPECIES: helix-turn-helix transcriptional regulator [unclassified Paenibacillus]MBU5442702.1 helix-turn-helix domain-containing protein [Paenibacillus sp. MSJ-34]CAH0120979.1 hypothetical protein PAE9249_03504 [Paenibacillus sp. CECT 9249]
MTMGDRLRQLRMNRNISQEEVARTIGITRSAYSHYEINNRQPVYETLLKLAAFYDVSLDYIVSGVSSRPDAGEANEIIRLLNTMDQDKRKYTIDLMMNMIKQNDETVI